MTTNDTWFYLYGGEKHGPFKTRDNAIADLSEYRNLPKSYASRFVYTLVDVRLLENGSLSGGYISNRDPGDENDYNDREREDH